MRRLIFLVLVFLLGTANVLAQTETPTPTATMTPTSTPTPEPYVHLTLEPESTGEPGQTARIDYTISAGQLYIVVLLALILLSGWAMFLFVFVIAGRRK